ncbi:MAG TPA: phage tail assembly protein [Azospirillum sp.]|nr:phage tail assembly protein [Azospirillum sp.]
MQKIILDYPVELAPHPRVTELVMRRPKAKDELEAKKRALIPDEIEMHLFALLTGQAFDVIAEVDLEGDYPKLQEAYKNFRSKPAATGAGAVPSTSESNASASPPTA